MVENHNHQAYREAKAQKEEETRCAEAAEQARKNRLDRLNECIRQGEDAYDQLYDPLDILTGMNAGDSPIRA